MTTPAQIIDWISYQRGVCIDRTGHYGAQAPDLVNDYAAELYGLPHIFGHGHDVAGNLARSHGWGSIDPTRPAQFGDVFSAGPYGDYGGGYGYCGVVIVERDAELVVFAQNTDGTGQDPARIQAIPRRVVIGLARPPIRY